MVRGEKWRGVEWRRCDDGMDLAGVQWRGSLAGYAKTILSKSRSPHSLIFGGRSTGYVGTHLQIQTVPKTRYSISRSSRTPV